jgi:hypothetical protein
MPGKESNGDEAAFTEEISKKVLDLFEITIKSRVVARVELKGTDLPTIVETAGKPLVINIGLPKDRNSLTVHIPHDKLGTAGNNYSYVTIRVNDGAELVIEADNSGYINGGVGDSTATGKFTAGRVEVMTGGKVRDGAYEGFPLGSRAVILNHVNSYLSIGPEPGSPDATDPKASGAYNMYFAGYLIGPSGSGARVEWDAGNTVDSYVDIRAGELVTNAQLTVKKHMGLIYSVWFIEDAKLTINTGSDDAGLVANESPGQDWNFYATKARTGIFTVTSGFIDENFFQAGGGGSHGQVTTNSVGTSAITSPVVTTKMGTDVSGNIIEE